MNDRIMAYMMGWRRGASGGATTKDQMQHRCFRDGFDDGRKAAGEAYSRASKYYGEQLSPLRIEQTHPERGGIDL